MPIKLILEIIIFSLLLIFIIMYIVRKGRISVKYSLVWLFSIFVLLITALIPNLMGSISNLLGFQTLSNMIFSILIGILIFICMSLTIIVSGQKEKIRLLVQEVSILKEKVNNMEKPNEK